MSALLHPFLFIPLLAPLATTPLSSSRWVWQEESQLTAGDAASGDWFGNSVSLSGDTALIGAPWDDHAGGTDAGSAYVYVRSGSLWSLQAKLSASDAAGGDNFGFSVCLSDDTALISAFADDLGAETDAGSAYVFVRSGTSWSQQAKLTAGDAAAEDAFGTAVSLEGDTALVGAYTEDGLHVDSGAAYAFLRTGTSWSEEAKLVAGDPKAGDLFGTCVALSGGTALVGAPFDDHGLFTDAGSVFVFVRSGSSWNRVAMLTSSDAESNDVFGFRAALSGDLALVGAPYDSHVGGTGAGSIYTYERVGLSWNELSRFSPAGVEDGDQFGYAVALEGDTALVSSISDDLGSKLDVGSAYLYSRSGTSWSQEAWLSASDGEADDNLGAWVSLSAGTALVGAPLDQVGGAITGSVYVFTWCAGSHAASETVRLGSPANPFAFFHGQTSGPLLGATWDPVIDHTLFYPTATIDFVGVDFRGPINLPTAFGTLLCLPPPRSQLFFSGPGIPFAIAVPNECRFLGLAAVAQGFSFSAAGGVQLTNALDIELGTF